MERHSVKDDVQYLELTCLQMLLSGWSSSSKPCVTKRGRCCTTPICWGSFAESVDCCFTGYDLCSCLTVQHQPSRSAQPSHVVGICLHGCLHLTQQDVPSCIQAVLLVCRRREEQSVKLRKTAEKLLLNQLKKQALKKVSGSQQAVILEQAQQASEPVPTDSQEVPADLLVGCSHSILWCNGHACRAP